MRTEVSKKRWICGNAAKVEKDIKEAIGDYTMRMRSDAFRYTKEKGLPNPVRAKITVVVEWDENADTE